MIAERRWPWIAQQNWENVLFIHTPVAYGTLREMVPHPFAIDTHQGTAWMSIVLFRATGSRLRYMPKQFAYPDFYQMNMRTYVRFGRERGVYFFSIHTNSGLVNAGGSALASLPFSKAGMQMEEQNDSLRFDAQGLLSIPTSRFSVRYRPDSAAFMPSSDSLSHFLSERYCVWMVQGKTIVKAPIFHTHWQPQRADISILECECFPFPITDESIFYYTALKHAVLHPFERVGKVSYGS